jgi:murein L,D-transpeptidase YcbB/YkuD
MFFSSNKIGIALSKGLLIVFIMSCFAVYSSAKQPVLNKDSITVQKFYSTYHEPLFWLSSGKNIKRANEWLKLIESEDNSGFVSNKTENDQIRKVLSTKKLKDNILKEKTDKQITGLVLNFMKYLHQGNVSFEYDEVNVPRDSFYISQLIFSGQKTSVSRIVSMLDCKDNEYQVLKKFLHDSVPDKSTFKYKAVLLAMNYRKYITINLQSEYILVNIPATEAEYYKDRLLTLKMRIVVGKKLKPTPTISSYITNIVTFPKWNVPFDIGVKEVLPKVQKNESYLEQNDYDVVDSKGNVIDDSDLNWKNYNEKNFPYYFRQSSGSDNSLGVLKFNLGNPFSIYLHSTSQPSAFAKDLRFLSHGCIRLEKPYELAADMLRGQIDIEELKSGKKNTESKTIKLRHKIPVFIIYVPVKVVGKKVTFLKDVYALVK